jgi:hypothetical protein
MDDVNNPFTLDVKAEERAAELPTEPFPCPACGQLLAPTCRVCVACKHPIDRAELARRHAVAASRPLMAGTEPLPAPVRYPWRLLFTFLGISFAMAVVFEALWGQEKAQLAMGGAQTLAGVWVFFDAVRQRVARPFRWAMGSMLLPVVIFPWYWARRRTPQAPVPFVEAEAGPVTRLLLYVLLAFVLASLIYYKVKGPPPSNTPTIKFKEHKTAGSSIAGFRRPPLRKERG